MKDFILWFAGFFITAIGFLALLAACIFIGYCCGEFIWFLHRLLEGAMIV